MFCNISGRSLYILDACLPRKEFLWSIVKVFALSLKSVIMNSSPCFCQVYVGIGLPLYCALKRFSLFLNASSARLRSVMSRVTVNIPFGLKLLSLRKDAASSTQIVEPSLQYSSSSIRAVLVGSAVGLDSKAI